MHEPRLPRTGKVDFHLHSEASNVTDYYAANQFAIPESYSDPLVLHALLKARGMDLVTLTDHNSIDGVKAMLDRGLPDVFISAEMTTTFPEDGCNIHITIANVSEAQFAEAHRLRGNVYEMVAYLDAEIARENSAGGANLLLYFMTHPLMSTQNRPYGREGSLRVAHLEKALLLCNTLEVRNGARTRALNELTHDLVRRLDREMIERLADRHGLPPKGDTPWLKSVVGGSDDHSGINPGLTWTAFEVDASEPAPFTANAMVRAVRARRSRPEGAHGGPITIAHSILKLLYEGSQRRARTRGNPQESMLAVAGPLQSLLQIVFDGQPRSWADKMRFQMRSLILAWQRGRSRAPRTLPFEAVLEGEIHAMLADGTLRADLTRAASTDERIFLVVKTLVNRLFAHYVASLSAAASLDLVGAIKATVTLAASNLFVSLPYLMAYVQQSADGQIARDARRAFRVHQPRRLVLITDTLFEVNGVSNTIRRMMREAKRRHIAFTVVACVGAGELEERLADPELAGFAAEGRLKLFEAVASLDFPEYEGLRIHFPPFLDLLKYLQESGFTKMQISTPGVAGVAGLLCAKLLQIDTSATYHTSIPEYVENYTQDLSLEALAWKYMVLFYHSVDETLVPSRHVAKLLHARGLRNRKLMILDRWVDVNRFTPAKRKQGYWDRHGVSRDTVKFVYVGRVAVEKSLHHLATAMRHLTAAHAGRVHLVVIGDGPYRAELARQVDGVACTFTGVLHGEELVTALASCDVKVFPSTTDTWGNAPLEAQAAGLPVIVTDTGGPCELVQDGVTGLVVRGNDAPALARAMAALLDPQLRARMGAAARAYAVANRVEEPYSAVLDADAYRRRVRREARLREQLAGIDASLAAVLGPSAAAPETLEQRPSSALL
jgi:glycosyltransferase involved in cell wall biosynthesis